MPYTPPDIMDLLFNFDPATGGYTPPDFNAIAFDLREKVYSTSDLSSVIQVMQIYTDTTYSEVKACPTIVVGYGASGVQTLQLPCEYLGIRDIRASIYGNLYNYDLAVYITGLSAITSDYRDIQSAIKTLTPSTGDLTSLLHSWDTSDLTSLLQAYDTSNVGSYIKSTSPGSGLLQAVIRIWHQSYSDLLGSISGFKGVAVPYDLTAYLVSIPPADLQAYLNVIELRDLPVEIYPQKYKGYGDYISALRGLFRNISDITTTLHGWDTSDIQQLIVCAHASDLLGIIQGSITVALQSSIYPVSPIGLISSIRGFAIAVIGAELTGVYSPGDLLSAVYGIPPSDLLVRISGFKEVEAYRSLIGYIESYYYKVLTSSISSVTPVDLGGYIEASGGYKDLDVIITPRIISLRQSLYINTIESRMLHSVINSGCFASSWRDFSTSLYAYDKLDLNARIFARLHDEDNQKDLMGMINVGYISEDTLDLKILVADRYEKLPIYRTRPELRYTEDSLYVTFSSSFDNFRNMRRESSDLHSYIRSALWESSLSSRIVAVRDLNFSTKDTKEKQIQRTYMLNLEKTRQSWRREIAVYFKSLAKEYYYFQGDGSVFRKDPTSHVTIKVEGYENFSGSGTGIEKGKVRNKYVFKLSSYSTVDEAIREAIDRVGAFRSADMYSSIFGSLGIGNYVYLGSSILPMYSTYTSRGIISYLTGVASTTTDLPFSINGELYKTDLNVSITGADYGTPNPLEVYFIFDDTDPVVGGSVANFVFARGV